MRIVKLTFLVATWRASTENLTNRVEKDGKRGKGGGGLKEREVVMSVCLGAVPTFRPSFCTRDLSRRVCGIHRHPTGSLK